jgi:hypothetical protein
MERVRLAVIVLMPAFGLLVSIQGLPGCGDVFTFTGAPDWICSFEGAQDHSAESIFGLEIATGMLHSRTGKHVGKGALLNVEPSFQAPGHEQIYLSVSNRRESPLDLRMSWQFSSRAALEPRAPSSVS